MDIREEAKHLLKDLELDDTARSEEDVKRIIQSFKWVELKARAEAWEDAKKDKGRKPGW